MQLMTLIINSQISRENHFQTVWLPRTTNPPFLIKILTRKLFFFLTTKQLQKMIENYRFFFCSEIFFSIILC